MEYYSAIKKKTEWNNAICSNLGRPRDYYAKLEVSQTETNIWYHLHVECKMWYKWIYLQNRNRLTDVENKSMATKGEKGGEG